MAIGSTFTPHHMIHSKVSTHLKINYEHGRHWQLSGNALRAEEDAMISIKNPKIERLIDEILKRSRYSDPLQYLESRIKSDYEIVMKNKKLT